MRISGTHMFQLSKKLKHIKYEIKDWPKKYLGNLWDKISKNEHKFEYVEEGLLENPNSFCFNSWMERLLKQRVKLVLFNHKYWGKLSRKNWLNNGDRNTKKFQRIACARRKRNKVIIIKKMIVAYGSMTRK